ncbi:MAG: c-type cytochrome [Gemmatimonadetes bacterium]|nr:c-type cytochrome [Gemmatimonadota bacterium]MCC6774948.1 c-type cytochrome [Gemmatimonadaceae bacterium]
MHTTLRFAIALAGIAITGACSREAANRPADSSAPDTISSAAVAPAELAVFATLPAEMVADEHPVTDSKVALGRRLYYETVLSQGHDLSCNTCHPLNGWGADGRPVSFGHEGKAGNRNAPTVYNAAGHLAQFWDGRAADVETQAKGPILNPIEMGMLDSAAVLEHLRNSAEYVAAFLKAFPEERQPVTYDNVGHAIGSFERRLVTPSRWDAFLQGDSAALTADEQRGLRTFLSAGCQSCHNGPYLGGNSFQKVGAVNAWPSQADSGRFAVTKDPKDLFVFKVPSLRNIEKTAPYFHDGSVTSLDEAVRLMAYHQLGKTLGPSQLGAIVTWLRSLTGDIPTDYIALPQQPK